MKQIIGIPCYKNSLTIRKVIYDIKKNSIENFVVVCIDGINNPENKESYLMLEKEDDPLVKPNLLIVNNENFGRTFTLLKIIQAIAIDKSFLNGNFIFSYVDADGQQIWSEMYHQLYKNISFSELGHIERIGEVKMAKKRILFEKEINLFFIEMLKDCYKNNRMINRYIEENLISNNPTSTMSVQVAGSGRWIRDLQNHICIGGKILQKLTAGIKGARNSFELEIILATLRANIPIKWGTRYDYGTGVNKGKEIFYSIFIRELINIFTEQLKMERKYILEHIKNHKLY